jgi:rhamnose transport system permease protein
MANDTSPERHPESTRGVSIGRVASYARSANLVDAVARFREIGILIFLVGLIIVFSVRTPRFFSGGNFRDILLDTSLLTIIAIGETLVIISRNIDLSVGSIVGFGAFASAVLVKDYPHLSVAIVVLAGIAIGAGLGLINGLLVTVGRIPAIIATLGTLFVYRSATYLLGTHWTATGQVYSENLTNSFLNLATGSILGIPNLIFFAAVVAVIFSYVLRYTRFGRSIYAVGSNPDAATLAGVNVFRTTLAVFILSGALAGLASVLWASKYANIDTTQATGYELQAVAAAVIGGTNIFGGSGSVLGTVLGSLLLGAIGNYLAISRVSEFWQRVVQGAIILAAIVTDALINRRLQALLQRRRSAAYAESAPTGAESVAKTGAGP